MRLFLLLALWWALKWFLPMVMTDLWVMSRTLPVKSLACFKEALRRNVEAWCADCFGEVCLSWNCQMLNMLWSFTKGKAKNSVQTFPLKLLCANTSSKRALMLLCEAYKKFHPSHAIQAVTVEVIEGDTTSATDGSWCCLLLNKLRRVTMHIRFVSCVLWD